MYWLTGNFNSEEWTVSEDHPDKSTPWKMCPSDHVANMQRHTDRFLQPARDCPGIGRLKLNSAYRGASLNTAVGSKNPTSRHTTGNATDVVPLDCTLEHLWLCIVNGEIPGASFDRAAVYTTRGFIHVDQRPPSDGPPRGLLYLSDGKSAWQALTLEEARKVFSDGD